MTAVRHDRAMRTLLGTIGLLFASTAPIAGGAPRAQAQAAAAAAPALTAPVLELLPQHLKLRIEQLDPSANGEALARSAEDLQQLQWVYQKSLMWIPGSTLHICFIGGDDTLNARIVKAASAWTQYANLSFDSGPADHPTRCSASDRSEIRVGFGYRGYWSLLGQTSIDFSVVGPGEQSMNFVGWDVRPPLPAELQRVVQHEFGHAIGLHHEHQNPAGGCDAEFDFEKLYAELAAPPNGWSKETVDYNLKSLPDSSLIEHSGHDPLSIMHYSFEPWFFKKGSASPCYVPTNFAISEKDIEGVGKIYPMTKVADLLDARAGAIAAAADGLQANQEPTAKLLRSELGRRAEALQQSVRALR